tara:strand:- start:1398 stop:3995 length:2598 start_codon:yes stop_codon:yes gene_type:complete
MNIISEQEFGELLDEFIREGEFKNKTGNLEEDKQILNRIAGKTEKLENIEARLPQMDERIKTIAALSDLAEIVEVDMLLGPDKIFTKQTSKVLSDSYSVAEVFNRLTDITQTAWDERVSLTGDNWKVTMAQCEAYIQDGVFKEYPEIDDILIGVIIAGEKQTEGREEVQVDTKKLDELFDGFRKYQLEDAGDRKKIYEYWAGTDATFKSFEEIVIEMPIMDAVIRLKREDPEQARTSMDNTRKVIIEKYSKVIDKINNLKIPKYTITYPTPPTMDQYSQEVSLVKLAGDLVYQITRVDTKEYREIFSRGISSDEVDIQDETQYAQNENPGDNTTTSSVDYDVQVGEELVAEVEMIEKMADPLSLLAAKLNKSQLYVEDGLATKVEEKVVEELSEYLQNPDILDMVKESYLDQIKEFVGEIKSDFVKEGPYTFMILDDKKNSSILTKFKSDTEKYKFTLEYYQPVTQDNNIKLILKTVEKNSYIDYINSVNEMANELFDTIVEIKNILPEARFNRNVARKPVNTKPGSARTASLSGGNYIEQPGEFAETLQGEDDLTYGFFEQLVSIFNQYYFDIIDSRYLFEMDKPNFIQSDSYKKIAALSTKTGTSVRAGIRRAMVKRANINITKEDFEKLNGFFDGLKRYSQLETQKAIELFDNVTPVFRKLYLMDLPESDSRRKQITSINQNLTNYMGKLLFEILVASQRISEGEANISVSYKGKSLDEYRDASTDITQLKIFDVLEDEEFIEYARDNGLATSLRKLKRTLRRNPLKITRKLTDKDAMYKAYVEALDTLKSNRGEKIYKAYFDFNDVGDVEYVLDLIEKEDHIDLYARDIEGIIKSYDSFNTLSSYYGISDDIIYKVKGLFR